MFKPYLANEAQIDDRSEFDYKRCVISTRSIVLPTSALRNVNVVTRKLDPDQTSVAHTHTERNECDKTRGHIVIILLGLGNVDCTG